MGVRGRGFDRSIEGPREEMAGEEFSEHKSRPEWGLRPESSVCE